MNLTAPELAGWILGGLCLTNTIEDIDGSSWRASLLATGDDICSGGVLYWRIVALPSLLDSPDDNE